MYTVANKQGGVRGEFVAVNAVKQKIMCIVLLCCSCCALFNEAAAGSIYMTYL
jgi:hypothetical protein